MQENLEVRRGEAGEEEASAAASNMAGAQPEGAEAEAESSLRALGEHAETRATEEEEALAEQREAPHLPAQRWSGGARECGAAPSIQPSDT